LNNLFRYEHKLGFKDFAMADAPNWMVSRASIASQFPLETQSRGRELSALEQEFAQALEKIFDQNIHQMEQVAQALSATGTTAPTTGETQWDLKSLERELGAINASLDEAFEENGYGA
jgi:hypothetical protein